MNGFIVYKYTVLDSKCPVCLILAWCEIELEPFIPILPDKLKVGRLKAQNKWFKISPFSAIHLPYSLKALNNPG